MSLLRRSRTFVLALLLASCSQTQDPTPRNPRPASDASSSEVIIKGSTTSSTAEIATSEQSGWKHAGKPKELSASTRKGLDWLVAHQLANGGWGQGDESPHMGGSNQAPMRELPSVADTSMAVLALMRSGSSPAKGTYQQSIYRGIGYLLSEIEESDEDSLYVTDVRGTRVQSKIGTYVDTFSSLMVLTEAKGKMPSSADNKRLEQALAKVLRKIEKNQRQDGTWDNQGWAPVLSQSMAAKGLNRAAQAGEQVKEDTLKRVEAQASSQFDAETGSFAKGSAAGIDLYAGAANSASLRDSVNTRKTKDRALRKKLQMAESENERAQVQAALDENAAAEKATESAEKALLARLEDPAFIQGFGNNGGEEFLSYMLVSEALVAKGGEDWKRWDEKMAALIGGVQNGDGSWTGHHCITGRTFCTAAALLVLMADRTPVPVAAQLRGG